MRRPAKAIQRKQFVFIDGGTTNLAATRIIPERLSTTVATQYPAIAAALALLRELVSFLP
jgi:DeoR/GlpR family transcriptional regulator of sugar metabolism